MGVSESRVVIETLSAACAEAEENEKDNIEDLLTSKVVLSVRCDAFGLKSQWVPGEALAAPRAIIPRQDLENELRKHTIRKLLSLKSLGENVLRWKERPLLFFTEDDSTLDLDELPLAQSYKYLTKVHERRESDTIRSRFLKVMYHRLKNRLCIDQMRPNNVEKAAHIILKSGLVSSDLETITRQVTGWTNEGRRIDALCQDIGCAEAKNDTHLGNIFCFPGDVHDEFIRAIPLSGPDREEEIRRLKIRGILDVEGKNNIDDLADAMFGKLWEKIEDSISRGTQFTGTGQAAPVPSTSTSNLHIAVSNSAAHLPTHGDGNEIARDSPGFSAEEISAPMVQSGSIGMVGEHTLAWMGSTLNMHENAYPIPQEPMDAIDERAIAWTGSTLNMHENAYPIPQEPMDAIDERAIAWTGSTLNMHENAYPIPQEPMDAIDERAIAWTGSTLNMHENAYPIPQEPMDAIDERAIAWMGSTLNMHENAYPIPQEPMDAIDERAVAWAGSTLSMHENADPIPRESMDMLQDRDIFGPDGAVEPFAVEYRDPESQTSIETPNISSQYHWSISRQQIQWPVVVK
ncbi:uncharacterized protein N7506_000112 [Penicillium brevicompactum]|uniref:uncharacterized protein n=1 Tax=Penicillium brevicompactum TaxID=5074 RepID=UPI002541B065|nr:uncharacterized protein N7506_000112 [Penicillium brevicompactum]KAJ5346859.1 hypothetical protein N7506_000112 [Penicillium brevicompactum]